MPIDQSPSINRISMKSHIRRCVSDGNLTQPRLSEERARNTLNHIGIHDRQLQSCLYFLMPGSAQLNQHPYKRDLLYSGEGIDPLTLSKLKEEPDSIAFTDINGVSFSVSWKQFELFEKNRNGEESLFNPETKQPLSLNSKLLFTALFWAKNEEISSEKRASYFKVSAYRLTTNSQYSQLILKIHDRILHQFNSEIYL